MVVEFSVQNFRSIKELQTLSFSATGLKSSEAFSEVDLNNIIHEQGSRILKTVGIYGANNSGKSNIVKALVYFLQAIKNEPSSTSLLGLLCDPFKYQEYPNANPSFFQIIVLLDGRKFRYGFTVRNNPNTRVETIQHSTELIENEWLYVTKEKNIGKYFERTGMKVESERSNAALKVPDLPYPHTLYLTHDSAFQANEASNKLRTYLKAWTISNVIPEQDFFKFNTLMLLDKENRKDEFLSILSEFNLPFDDIILEQDESKEIKVLRHDKVTLKKSYVDKENQTHSVNLNLAKTESAGTQKLFDIIGMLLRVFSLRFSTFIIIDEVDSNFHPALLIKVLKLFNDPKLNKSKSQLLFTSHDTNLLSPEVMRRDQFYFTEKRSDQSTRLYSLSDLKGIRNDADFARQYLLGYYGALPVFETYCVPQASTK